MKRKDRFPGFDSCMKMMRKRNPTIAEHGFHWLLPHAGELVGPLMEEFRREDKDHGLRCWLLELIGEARDPRALDLSVEQMGSSDESLRDWAVRGLRLMNTSESRTVLYKAGIKSKL